MAFSSGVWYGGRENDHPRNGFEPISKAKDVSGRPGIDLFIILCDSFIVYRNLKSLFLCYFHVSGFLDGAILYCCSFSVPFLTCL